MYGSETMIWKQERSRIRDVQMHNFRDLLGIRRMKVPNASSSLPPNTSLKEASLLITAASTSSFHHTLLGLFLPPLSPSHKLLHFQPLPDYILSHMLNIIFSIPFYNLPLKRPNISLSVLMFPQFLISNPPSSIHHFSPLNLCPHQPDFTQYNMVI